MYRQLARIYINNMKAQLCVHTHATSTGRLYKLPEKKFFYLKRVIVTPAVYPRLAAPALDAF